MRFKFNVSIRSQVATPNTNELLGLETPEGDEIERLLLDFSSQLQQLRRKIRLFGAAQRARKVKSRI